jgi:hypothetical protein
MITLSKSSINFLMLTLILEEIKVLILAKEQYYLKSAIEKILSVSVKIQ